MPVEVLTREEIEKIVEEKLKKLLSEMRISGKMAELEASTAKLKEDIGKLSLKKPPVAEPDNVAVALTRDLAQLENLLQIGITSSSVTLKPKRYLGAQDFRAVSEIVRKHGGSWFSERGIFIVRKRV